MNSRGAWRGQSKHVALTVMNNHLIQPSSLSLVLCEPPWLSSRLFSSVSHTLSCNQTKQSVWSLQPREHTGQRESVSVETSTEWGESPQGWRCTTDNTVAMCLDGVIKRANIQAGSYMQAHKLSHIETRKPHCYSKIWNNPLNSVGFRVLR